MLLYTHGLPLDHQKKVMGIAIGPLYQRSNIDCNQVFARSKPLFERSVRVIRAV